MRRLTSPGWPGNLLALALALPHWRCDLRPCPPASPRLRMAANLRGLGSRGPPLPL